MPRSIALLLIIVLATVSAYASQTNGNDSDRTAIEAVAARWQEAWNSHNMDALSALVAEDVDFVTVGGTWLKDRKAFKKHHADRHEMQFRESVWTTDKTSVEFVRSDIAVAHVEWGIRGDKDPGGTSRQPRQGIFTWVLEKRGRAWTIIAAQNTNRQQPAAR